MINDYDGSNKIIHEYEYVGYNVSLHVDYDVFDLSFPKIDNYVDGIMIIDYDHEGRRKLTIPDTNIPAKHYFQVKINANRQYRIILSTWAPLHTKFWLNSEIIYIRTNKLFPMGQSYIELMPGENILLIEIPTDTKDEVLSVLLSDYSIENTDDPLAFSNSTPSPMGASYRTPIFLSEYNECTHVLRFMLLKNFHQNLQQVYIVTIVGKNHRCIHTLKCNLGEMTEIDLNVVLSKENVSETVLKLYFETITLSGEKIEIHKKYLIVDITDKKEQIIARGKSISKQCNSFVKAQILGRIEHLLLPYMNEDCLAQFEIIEQLEEIFEQFENSEYDSSFCFQEGSHTLFFQSLLDGSYIRVLLSLPPLFNKNDSYPVIFNITTAHYSDAPKFFDHSRLNEGVIYVDASGRGVTGGSYIGEVSIREVINWVSEFYLKTC